MCHYVSLYNWGARSNFVPSYLMKCVCPGLDPKNRIEGRSIAGKSRTFCFCLEKACGGSPRGILQNCQSARQLRHPAGNDKPYRTVGEACGGSPRGILENCQSGSSTLTSATISLTYSWKGRSPRGILQKLSVGSSTSRHLSYFTVSLYVQLEKPLAEVPVEFL